jgi:poly(3-hydroxybutyrate) depolymerase
MHHQWSSILVLSSGLLAQAQTVNLRGTISSGGQPVSGAIVTLMKLGSKDTTGSDGAYSFSQSITALSPRSPGAGSISLSGGVLEFSLAEPSAVAIEVFDIKSNRLKAEKPAVQPAGLFRRNITGGFPSNQLLIVRATIGKEVSTFRYMPVGGGIAGPVSFRTSPDGPALAKSAAAVDSLEVAAAGYSTKKMVVESYEAKLDVSVDRLANPLDRWGGLKNPPVKSAGCGKSTTITSATRTIMSGGVTRSYLIDVPANYDMNKPHRLFVCSHGQGSTLQNIIRSNYYDIKTESVAAKEPVILVAGLGYASGSAAWGQVDHAFFDDLTGFVKDNMCVDTTRIFVTGMSMGGMHSYSLTTTRAHKIRAGVGIAPANYNIWLPAVKQTEPLAWMQTTGMSDNTTPWVSNEAQKRGSKFIALEKAANNGCTIPAEIPTWKSGPHVCYDFQGCKVGYPVKACTFNGGHNNTAFDPGSTVNWIGAESWKFFMQF